MAGAVIIELHIFGALLIGHAIADSLLQPPGLSQGKRSTRGSERWRALGAHGAVHGFFVALILAPAFGLAEAVAHALIDRAKGRGWISNEIDQILHVACKAIWLGLYLKWEC